MDEPDAPLDDADPVDYDDVAGGAGDEVAVHRPWWYRVGTALLVVAVLLFLIPPLAHIFFPPINPRQTAPPGHFSSGCWACHDVNASARIMTFD